MFRSDPRVTCVERVVVILNGKTSRTRGPWFAQVTAAESEAESEGQLTKDAAAAFKQLPPKNVRIYYWPLAKRDRNPAGRPGKLHVKCAVIDDAALIGSANLTDDAFNRNMELGVLIREPATIHAIEHHFDELIRQGYFAEVGSPQH